MGFILSKVFWVFFAPGNFLVLLLVLGGFLSTAHTRVWTNIGRKICFDIAFVFFFVAIFPIGDWLLTPLENAFPPVKPDHVDGIIILGGDEKPEMTEMRGQPVMLESANRYIHFAALAREYPKAKLVFTGGSGRLKTDTRLKDAEVAKQGLSQAGVPVERMVFEDRSRNTYENAKDTAEIVHPTPQENWLLVTSAWHMPRSIASFRKAGWMVYPAPTDYLTTGAFATQLQFNLSEHLFKLTVAAHEYYGLLAYRLLGYTDHLWPK